VTDGCVQVDTSRDATTRAKAEQATAERERDEARRAVAGLKAGHAAAEAQLGALRDAATRAGAELAAAEREPDEARRAAVDAAAARVAAAAEAECQLDAVEKARADSAAEVATLQGKVQSLLAQSLEVKEKRDVSRRHAQEHRQLRQQVQKLGAGHLGEVVQSLRSLVCERKATELAQRSALARAHGLLQAVLAVPVRTLRFCLPRPRAMYSLHWTS
jgi:hypothetical protein